MPVDELAEAALTLRHILEAMNDGHPVSRISVEMALDHVNRAIANEKATHADRT